MVSLPTRNCCWLRIFGRLSDGVSRAFAGALEGLGQPFHVVNYFGSVGGQGLLGYTGMGRRFDQVVDKLLRHLDRESDSELSRGMRYPTSWDPYFKAYMTLADVYRYQTQHVEHHRRQLSAFRTEPVLVCQPHRAPAGRTAFLTLVVVVLIILLPFFATPRIRVAVVTLSARHELAGRAR